MELMRAALTEAGRTVEPMLIDTPDVVPLLLRVAMIKRRSSPPASMTTMRLLLIGLHLPQLRFRFLPVQARGGQQVREMNAPFVLCPPVFCAQLGDLGFDCLHCFLRHQP